MLDQLELIKGLFVLGLVTFTAYMVFSDPKKKRK